MQIDLNGLMGIHRYS